MSAPALAGIWEGLTSGACEVTSWSHTSKTWSLVVARRREVARVPSPRNLKILKHALLCGVTAQVAARSKLSKASVAVIQKDCLHFMGVTCNPSRVPGLVVAAAHAHDRIRRVDLPSSPTTKITVQRFDRVLACHLTASEYEVIKLLMEGWSYAEIALERDISVRTVANQVQLSFRRLGVSGRTDLMCQLAAVWVGDQ